MRIMIIKNLEEIIMILIKNILCKIIVDLK